MNRDTASRWWRPVGIWFMTINVALGFPGMIMGVLLRPEAEWSTVGAAYASILAAWVVAAGIRQHGKNNGSEE